MFGALEARPFRDPNTEPHEAEDFRRGNHPSIWSSRSKLTEPERYDAGVILKAYHDSS